jgi:uncharacterized membrane protein YkoI
MPLRAAVVIAFLLVSACAGAAMAAELSGCLGKEQQRAALAAGRVISLSDAKRAVDARKGEVVRAQLCQRQIGLVYLLTLLARDGKVTHLTVDAASGRLASGSERR